ncbi:FtsK/SpoIIIE domain-containing protein [Microbacterium sp. K36]|uniref:FtsK/SpoIIIE domain-containing protein n=1 Tax=Microbacterium sp. K36 TaxID=2305439 RepID=UPI00109D07E8|nr:FtsK/SpoIIIE domain-containing protein [Microbacterium sp. K36]
MDLSPLLLPSAIPPARRRALPIVAAVVPVGVGLALWGATGAVHALWFAALGPLMLGASLVDSARGRRRERRLDADRVSAAWSELEAELQRRHARERAQEEQRHPDAASCVRDRPLRDARPPGEDTSLVVGRGSRVSTVRCEGGDGERADDFRRRCGVLDDVPQVVPLGRGVCLRGPMPLVQAAARGFVVQLCLRFSPGALSLVVGPDVREPAAAAFPHVQRARRGGFRLALAAEASSEPSADAVIWVMPAGADVPEGITTVLDIEEPGAAVLRTPDGVVELDVEFLSSAQAEAAAELCGGQADAAQADAPVVVLRDLPQPPIGTGLLVALGRGAHGEPVTADIVDDGPHAIVTGMTGTGKSELLITWVAAICAGYGPDRVNFLLADFKGGTAFERLRDLPQVVGVLTDLDETEARRGVASLAAEMRRRESALAAARARDVRETDLPRLLIVVDEFAALLQEHTELAAVFTDVAARGRALGMHLVLGTQRAAGVIRDALATNCPLRLSLRVAEAADSRAMLGSSGAAELPGGPEGRGRALLRRPQDDEPLAVRIALTDDDVIRSIGQRWAGAQACPPPWQPALPVRLPLPALIEHAASAGLSGTDSRVVLGRADDPEHQTQPLELLRPGRERGLVVLGAPGTGRTTVLRVIAAQHPDSTWFPDDPEAAVDLLAAWAEGEVAPPDLVLADDLDQLHAVLPLEVGHEFVQRWEQVVRSATGTTWVLTAGRMTGPLARVLEALPRRALLRMPTRVEHLAAGGEVAHFRRDRPAGRALLGEREMQFAWVEGSGALRRSGVPRRGTTAWVPQTEMTALVTPGAPAVVAALMTAHPEWDVRSVDSEVREAGKPLVLVADAETWQRYVALWQHVRSRGEVLIRAERPSELRQLVGVRGLPPYARPDAGRAWSVIGDRPPRRVVLPALGRR